METVITRDTDILREYLVALDARERGLSPFARLVATIKLAALRRELGQAQLETTDEDLNSLRREVDERLGRNWLRRVESNSWGARAAVFLIVVLGQQLALALILLATMLFVRLAPVPRWWNPVLPHEEPVFLFAFTFFFFFATPMLALLVLFGGRYFRSWQRTMPATLIILALAAVMTYAVAQGKLNPVQRSTSLSQLAVSRGLNVESYRQWVDANWLMKDTKFQRDYETYLRNGPGRWVTSRIKADDDAAWRDALPVVGEYLDGGQDPASFREWLKYYLDRNRIYSEDRIDQEVNAITGEANQRFLGIWQVEPYLKERDTRTYRAYFGSINRSMKQWGLAALALFTLVFLIIYVTGPLLSVWERMAGRVKVRVRRNGAGTYDPDQRDIREQAATGRAARWRESYYSFPERRDITTPPFFDTPFKLLSRVHRSFVRLAVFTSIFVFLFWAAVYAIDMASDRPNPPSQVALMRSNLLLGGPSDEPAAPDILQAQASAGETQQNFNYATLTEHPMYWLGVAPYNPASAGGLLGGARTPQRTLSLLAARLIELERRLDEADYQNTKKFKEQNQIIASQRSEIETLRGLASQLQQTTGGLPDQLADLGSRASAAEARAGSVLGEVSAAKQVAEGIEKQLTAKLSEAENRAARAIEEVGKVEDQASVLATRTEALEKELDRRSRQIEARTEELGERTAGLKENEERIVRLQRVAFTALLNGIKSDVEDLDRRTQSAFYRFLNKGEARRDVESLRQRIAALTAELRGIDTEQTKQLLEQLDEFGKRLEEVATRVK